MAVGAGASRLSAELAAGYREAVGSGGGGNGMGLADAVRLAARVLSRERARERKSRNTRTRAALAEGKGGEVNGREREREREEFGDIGMEIATIAVEKDGDGRAAATSAYIYNDADVERVLESLEDEET